MMNGGWEQSNWTKRAVEEAEAVASISCSGHGRAFLDGLSSLDHNGYKSICECNACFKGPDCSEHIPNCEVDADSGDPMFLEPFWLKHAASSVIVVPGWHRMSYEFNDGLLISEKLKSHILKLHTMVGNAKTDGRYIVFGAGATQLLNAAVHALSSSSVPSRVVASVPYYPVYKEQTEFFQSEDYKFEGDTLSWKENNKDFSSSNYIEFVTSPNNPDGELMKAVLQRESVKTIHDLAYYWPHFTPIPAPADEDLMIFTISKLTGHAGSRFGWAIVKDEAVYERMLKYMSLKYIVLKLLKVVVEGEASHEIFEFGFKTMGNRCRKLNKIFSMSRRFSLQDLEHQYCSFSKKLRAPSPAFAWIKCEKEEDKDCFQVLKSGANIIGRRGSFFGAESHYVRLSLVKTQDDFALLLERMEMLVHQENHNNNNNNLLEFDNYGSGCGTRANSSIIFDVEKYVYKIHRQIKNVLIKILDT